MARDASTTRFLRAFGTAVRDAREGVGWSQEELGFEADLDRTYVSGVERGIRNPTLAVVYRISKALGVQPSELLRGIEQ